MSADRQEKDGLTLKPENEMEVSHYTRFINHLRIDKNKLSHLKIFFKVPKNGGFHFNLVLYSTSIKNQFWTKTKQIEEITLAFIKLL